MSKLTKLLRHPWLFFADSTLLRRARFLPRAHTFLPRAEKPKTAFDPTFDEAVRELATEVPLITVPTGQRGRRRLGLRRQDQDYLTRAFIRHVVSGGELSLKPERGRSFPVSNKKLFELEDFLSTHKWFTARFSGGQGPPVRIQFEFWEEAGTNLTAPRRNPIVRRLSTHTIEEMELFRPGPVRKAEEVSGSPLVSECLFDVDIVYTWVNSSDPDWRAMYTAATGKKPEGETSDAKNIDRFLSRDELRYSLRSLAAFAPWVRRIHIVTNCAPPPWLDTEHPKIRWVCHEEILPSDALPTFSSHAIEARLQHIQGLSEYFLYFNDDFFLCRSCEKEDFFFSNGMTRAFVEEYGVVNGRVHPADPDYLNAARNGKALLEADFGRSAVALHKHTPYALSRDVLLEMERRFAEPIARTVKNQFRTPRDISTVSFLYHHYAYLTRRALYAGRDAVLIKQASPTYLNQMRALLAGKKTPATFCINDGLGSARNPTWDRHVQSFLDAFFPTPCEFERRSPQDIPALTDGDDHVAPPPGDSAQNDVRRAY